MPQLQSRPSVLLNWIHVDRGSAAPLYRQVADQIRDALLAGRIAPGDYLPASRALALDLGVSRITTLQAFEQLVAEGFLETRRGSGTRAAVALPTKRRRKNAASSRPFQPTHLQRLFQNEPESVSFQAGIPAFDAFPRLRWSRLLQRHAASADPTILDYTHIGGYVPLRQELATYLSGSRGVACEPQQVIVVSSTRAAVASVSSVLWQRRGMIAVEDPGYHTSQRVLTGAGLRLRHVLVDEKGFRVSDLIGGGPACVGAYLTPAHQWPTGRTLSAERRIRLLDWAVETGAWIIEDDYDSEFRFESPPLATLHGYGSGRVIYVGTFAKTLAPSIRTAYLVVPPDTIGAFEREVFQQGMEPPLHVQAALADFLAEGHFTRHIGRMRKLYAGRRERLINALTQTFGDRLTLRCPPGGLQIIGLLPDGVSDEAVSLRAAQADLVARPMSQWRVTCPDVHALQLGFAAVPDEQIEPGVARLHAAIADLL
jgi:GntR family transcriptional regulator / MocR family aminotransferase